jgi:hypothetical protein
MRNYGVDMRAVLVTSSSLRSGTFSSQSSSSPSIWRYTRSSPFSGEFGLAFVKSRLELPKKGEPPSSLRKRLMFTRNRHNRKWCGVVRLVNGITWTEDGVRLSLWCISHVSNSWLLSAASTSSGASLGATVTYSAFFSPLGRAEDSFVGWRETSASDTVFCRVRVGVALTELEGVALAGLRSVNGSFSFLGRTATSLPSS